MLSSFLHDMSHFIFFIFTFQYIFGALRDCIQPMSYIRHLKSSQDLFDSFDKEIFDQVKEVCTS